MKRPRLHTSLVSVLCALLLVMAFPLNVHATSRDEQAMDQVAHQLDGLWEFVDQSSQTPDEQFYPAFIARATAVARVLAASDQTLAHTTETGATKLAIQNTRIQIHTMITELDTWKAAATKADLGTFQQASDTLGATASAYNAQVADYHIAAHGTQAIGRVAVHAAIVGAVFMLTCFLFAWALYRNNKTDDIAAEIARRLRWHAAYASAICLTGVCIPAYLVLFQGTTPMWWMWILAMLGAALLVVVLYRSLKAYTLVRRALR